MDGELVPFREAHAHLIDPILHYGSDVFEEIRCYATERGPAIFRLDAHLKRFLDSVHVLDVHDMPYAMDELRNAVHVTVQANHFNECVIRPLLYFTTERGRNTNAYRPAVAVFAWDWATIAGGEQNSTGARRLVSASPHQYSAAGMTNGRLDSQYLNPNLAKSNLPRAGLEDAIMLDPEGFVADYTGETLFLVRDGVIHAPPQTPAPAEVTRDTIITLAGDAGYTFVEERLSREQVLAADELFVCDAMTGVVSVQEIDSRPVGNSHQYPVTSNLQDAYLQTIRGLGRRSRGWLDFVLGEPLY
jgi:branched-chain amino acid aminotransferase